MERLFWKPIWMMWLVWEGFPLWQEQEMKEIQPAILRDF